MNTKFRLLGILDVISVLLLLFQFISAMPLLTNAETASADHDLVWLSPYVLIPQLLLIPLLIISALGHFQASVYGLITYYIQFPLRFPALVFSIGFITYIDPWFPNLDISRYTLAVVIFGELLRLTYSIKTHIGMYRQKRIS